MTLPASAAARPFSPLRLEDRSRGVQFLAVVAGTAILALASRVDVPMVPVPVTLQTLAVTLIGALYGWRLGAVTVLAWLGQAAIGLPVLASGKFGLAPFVGPTAGYLFAFPLVAALTGWLAERGWTGERVVASFSAMLLGNALCLVLGFAWLATLIGPEKAFAVGVAPFLAGAVLKSAVGALALRVAPPRR